MRMDVANSGDLDQSRNIAKKRVHPAVKVGSVVASVAMVASGMVGVAKGQGWLGGGDSGQESSGSGSREVVELSDNPVVAEKPKPVEWVGEAGTVVDFLGQELMDDVLEQRQRYCDTEGREWCEDALGENINFPGLVVWITGADSGTVRGHSDTIMGYMIPTDGSPAVSVSMPRDMRVPGLSWSDGKKLLPGAPINQMSWVDAENPGRYNTFKIPQILGEATGMPADLVIQGSYEGFLDVVKYLYDLEGDEKFPFLVTEELSEANRIANGGSPFDKYFMKIAGEDRVIEPGMYDVTPEIALRLLRERYGGEKGNETRQANQMEFLIDLVKTAVLKNPARALKLIKTSSKFISEEEDALKIRVVGMSVPSRFNEDGNWADSGSLLARQLTKRAGNLAEGIKMANGVRGILKQIEKGKDLGVVSPSLVKGSEVRVIANPEGSVTMKGPKFNNIANSFDLTAADKLTYWDDLREAINKRLKQ